MLVETKLSRGRGLSEDHRKKVALDVMQHGEATLSDAARPLGVTRQVMANLAKRIDARAARERWLRQRWQARLKKLAE